MAYFILSYTFTEAGSAQREAQLQAHLSHVQAAAERGDLILAGPVGDAGDADVLLFHADAPEPVEAFAQADPYVIAGLVSRWAVLPWAVEYGRDFTG